jgi:hypothetical protein
MLKAYPLVSHGTKQITIISIIALLLGHLMINTYVPNTPLNFVGLLITALFIYVNTLQKNELFSFLMVIYFCSAFPYLSAKGGGFNMVSFVCILFYFLRRKKFPGEKKVRDSLFKMLIILFVLSSLLGWIFNYTGKGVDIVYSFITFFGIISLLLLSSRLEITRERVKYFLQLNFILIVYSTIVSINKYVKFVTFSTPIMPIYGYDTGYFEGGGLIGSSPLYGEHSMILFTLFAVILLLNKGSINVSKFSMFTAAFIALINVFMSVSRSVFLLSLIGLGMIFILQIKLHSVKFYSMLMQITLVFLFGVSVLFTVNRLKLDYVFNRVDEIEKTNKAEGGITLGRILDGSAFNRSTSFEEGYKRYNSKDSWLIGYGWGIGENNRDAYFVDPSIKRTSAHSQLFAVLFILGWIGFIAYFGLIFMMIIKSYKIAGNRNISYVNRLIAFFFMTAFSLFLFNEIKVDSINYPSYFTVTIIWMGLGYSNLNSTQLYKRGKVI